MVRENRDYKLTQNEKSLIQIALQSLIAVYTDRRAETQYDGYRTVFKTQIEKLEEIKRKIEKL